MCAAVVACVSVWAQGFTPTTTWPYVNNNFESGIIRLTNGSEKPGTFNICLDGNKLHFIDGQLVKSANLADVMNVRIGTDIYQNIGGEMLKVVAADDKALVVEGVEVDMAALNETGGAYGSSSTTTGTMALSSFTGIGATNSTSSVNHTDLIQKKDAGKMLSLIKKHYIFFGGNKIYAAKKDVLEAAKDKTAAAAFIKQNKIKWKDPQSLLLMGGYLASEK